MNFKLKEVIIKRGLKQKFIAESMEMEPVIFSKKLMGDLSFTNNEQVQLSKILNETVEKIFPDTTGT